MKTPFALMLVIPALIVGCGGGGGGGSSSGAPTDSPVVPQDDSEMEDPDTSPFEPIEPEPSPTTTPEPEPISMIAPSAFGSRVVAGDPNCIAATDLVIGMVGAPDSQTIQFPTETPSGLIRALFFYPDDSTTIIFEQRPASNDCNVFAELNSAEPEPITEPAAEPDHIVKTSFDGVSAYVLGFSTTEYGRLQVNSLFKSNRGSPTDAQCRIALISGLTEVAYSYISVDDLAAGDTVPDSTTFLEDGLDQSSFDTVRVSGCFTLEPNPSLESTPEPEFEYVVRTAFEGVEMFVLGFDYNQFGRFQVNGLVRNNSSETVDAQCRLTLISDNLVVDSSFLSVDDIQLGETVPDSTSFLGDSVNQDSFNRVRLSGCFTF